MGKRKHVGKEAACGRAGGGGEAKKRREEATGEKKKKTKEEKREKKTEKKKKKAKTVHVCAVCLYRAVQKSKLTVHMRTHTGVKPYACNKCTYRAAEKSLLTSHMRSKHDTSSTSAAKAPTSKAKLRRCAEPFTLFKIHEFESKADSDCFANI